ncbi:transferase [Streptomyces sp. NPDC057499]|uniref:transferase n=1 Tax=Streptomyces sp. NPDC057499 TaxID=3346150 RepID=UPI0036ACB737
MTTTAGRRAPRADCTVTPDGRITFDLSGHGGERTGAPELLLRLRGAKGPDARTVRLPLGPLDDGRLRAVLPADTEYAEGRWDVHLREADADDDGAVAVEPGIRDLRRLVGLAPGTGRVAVRIPYPTLDGRLAVRCWLRAPHAEAGAVTLDGAAMTVRGRLHGARSMDGAQVEARQPGDAGNVVRVPVTGGGEEGAFAFTLPLDRLADGPVTAQQLWTLWLLPGPGEAGEDGEGEGVRISRILDDIWDRKKIHVYPGRGAGAGVRATPCYSTDNDLCVRLEPEPAT